MLLKSKGILTDLQKEILLIFSKIPDSNNFYLTGGTALSEFYLGHRKSFDLDIFTIEKGLLLQYHILLKKKLKKFFY
jgi:predicted nucleotidyltransferase component of viral defense system